MHHRCTRRKREKRTENVFEEIMAENFPNLKKETDIQVQETQRVPNKMNQNRQTPRHIKIKMAIVKDKKRILKAAKEKQRVIYKGISISYQLIYLQKLCRPERMVMICSKCWKGKTCNLGYSTQQDYHFE